MSQVAIVSFLVIVVTVIFSYKGFSDRRFFGSWLFEVKKVLVKKEYKRLITTGFIHLNWMHLILNMLTLLFITSGLAGLINAWQFLAIYFGSLAGGNLFGLYVHRHNGTYAVAGAWGAVCGVMFASIALFPGMQIRLFFLPVSMPAWLYGAVYVVYSIYAIKTKKGNIGQDAHLVGGLAGMLIAFLFYPSLVLYNYLAVLFIALPVLVFIYLVVTRPAFLLTDGLRFKAEETYTIDQRYNIERTNKQQEVDRILDKIHRRGMNALSQREKQLLEEYSKNAD